MAQCQSGDILINGACFSQCPTGFVEAEYISPAACVQNVPCPAGFAQGETFSECIRTVVNRTSTPEIGGDCPIGYVYWNDVCTSSCPDGYSIASEAACHKDCPDDFLSTFSQCRKNSLLRTVTEATCTAGQYSTTEGQCRAHPSTSATVSFSWILGGICVFLVVLLVYFFLNSSRDDEKIISTHIQSRSTSPSSLSFTSVPSSPGSENS